MTYQYGARKSLEFTIADLERDETALVDALALVRKNLEVQRARLAMIPQARAVEVLPCGTYAAYMRHYRRGEEACRECRDAYNAYKSEVRPRSERRLMPCGTYAAYKRHLRHGEDLDDACREANKIHGREMRARKASRTPAETPRKRQNAA